MTLLNAIMGFGALAFSVPLLIHLLTRSRYQLLDWGAMHLLESAMAINRRRMRIEQLLLLLIRCAIPILLAFCMARPVLHYLHGMSADAPRSVAILLDNSPSMEAKLGEGTRMQRAREAVQEILDSLPQGSDVSVATIGGRVIPLTDQPTEDRRRLSRQVARIAADGGSVKVASALEAGLTMLLRGSHPRRQWFLVSDFQQSDWKGIESVHWKNLAERIKSLPTPPEFVWLPQTSPPVEGESSGKTPLDSIVVESIQQVQRTVTVDQPVEFQVVIRCRGAPTQSKVELTPYIDRLPQAAQSVELKPEATTQIPWHCRFGKPGSHVVEFVLATADNSIGKRRSLEVNVFPRGKVLLVDGDRRKEPLQSDTDYLALALAPYALGGLARTDPFIIEVVTTNELKESRLQHQQVLVLANVSRLNDDQLRWTKRFAETGGLVVICCGERVDADWYNQRLFLEKGIRLVERRGDPRDTSVNNRITRASFSQGLSPELGSLVNELPADGGTPVRRWWRLELANPSRTSGEQVAGTIETPSTVPSSAPNVIARFENGDPWWCQVAVPPETPKNHSAAKDKFGQLHVTPGTILISTIPCDADWSDLPSQPFFLPLIQRLLGQQIFRSNSGRNLSTGETLREVIVAQQPESSRANSERNNNSETKSLTELDVIWTDAQGTPSTMTLPVTDGLTVFEKGVDRSGVYQLQVNSPGKTSSDGKSSHQDFFYAVNTPASEFDLRTLADEEIAQIAEGIGAKVCRSTSELQQTMEGTGGGKEMTGWLWWGVLGLLLFEPWYAHWISRGNGE